MTTGLSRHALDLWLTCHMGTSVTHFEPGRIEAWAFVFDKTTQKIVCQAPVKARSAKTINFRTRGIAQKDHDDAIRDDFREKAREGLAKSLGSISEVIRN